MATDAALALCFALAACATSATPPHALIAEPGAGHVGVAVQLDGSGSTATREGAQLVLSWSFTALPALSRASLNDAHLAKPSFTPDAAGTYSLRLVVDDGILSDSAAADVVVADDCRPAPALSSTPATPGVGQTITLTAANSTSCGGTSSTLASFQWSFAATPAGSRAEIFQPQTAQAAFVPDVHGTYDVLLVAQDANGNHSDPLAATSHLLITVKACGDNAPAVSAIAANPASPDVQQRAQFVATVTHADTNAACGLTRVLSYDWRVLDLPAGSKARLNDATIASPSLTPDVAGTYTVGLVVTDDLGHQSAQQTGSFTTTSCGANVPTATPVAPTLASTAQVIQLHTTVHDLDNPAIDPTDPIGGAATTSTGGACSIALTFSYQWSLLAAPIGSHAALSGTQLANPSITPDVPGDYIVSVQVTASTGYTSAPASATITAGTCGSLPPQVTSIAGPQSTPVTGAAVKLAANVTDANSPCAADVGSALPLTYSWAIDSAPAGSLAALSGTAANGRSAEISPSFIPDRSGDYGVTLRVTNQLGLVSDTATTTITVADCNAPLTFADPAHPITLPSGVVTGTTVQLAASPVDPNAPSGSSCVAAVAPYRYAWTLAGLPPGSRAILNNAVAAAPSFTADIAGDYTVQLIVTDAAGNQSPRVSGTVTASSCTAPLTISGIGPQGGSTPTRGLPLPLTATVTDANAATSTCSGAGPFTPITYKWTFLDVPPGSTAQLRQSDTASPSFIPDQLGAYKVALTATDAKGLTGSNNATVTVAADCLARPSASGITPASGTTAQAIQLSATGVVSPNATAACGIAGTTLAYSWTLVGLPNGSLATLNNPASSSPSFTPDVGGTYSVQLRLTDALGNQSAIVPQDITVATCNAPFAAAAITPPASPKVNTAFALGATYSDPNASTASCGLTGTASTTPVTSRWTLLSRPPGSNASFSDVTAASPSITPDLAGTYVAQVTLTDALGNQGSATLTTPVSGCGAAFDSAVTVTPSTRTPETGQGVTLAAKVTDGNASGCNVPSAAPFSYAWTLAPGGTAVSSTAILSNPTSASPAFTPDLPGLYDYSVVVTDALGYQGVFSSAARTASINARTCALSVAVAAPTSTNTGSAAQLTATPSFTCSTGTLATTSVAYAWTFDSVAKGSTAQLNNTSIPNPSFTLDVPASSWTVRVTVTDPLNNATATTSTTIASNDCFKNAPDGSIGVSAVSGGTNTSVSKRNTTVPGSADATYTLAGLGANASLQLSVNQLNGGTAATNPNAACASPAPSLNYHWGIYQLPPSSASNISPATAALPVMNIDKTGTYVIQLTVDDGTLTSVPVYYRIQIN